MGELYLCLYSYMMVMVISIRLSNFLGPDRGIRFSRSDKYAIEEIEIDVYALVLAPQAGLSLLHWP